MTYSNCRKISRPQWKGSSCGGTSQYNTAQQRGWNGGRQRSASQLSGTGARRGVATGQGKRRQRQASRTPVGQAQPQTLPPAKPPPMPPTPPPPRPPATLVNQGLAPGTDDQAARRTYIQQRIAASKRSRKDILPFSYSDSVQEAERSAAKIKDLDQQLAQFNPLNQQVEAKRERQPKVLASVAAQSRNCKMVLDKLHETQSELKELQTSGQPAPAGHRNTEECKVSETQGQVRSSPGSLTWSLPGCDSSACNGITRTTNDYAFLVGCRSCWERRSTANRRRCCDLEEHGYLWGQ